MLAYVCAQPASFTFILSFVFITVSMPPMAAYIRNADQLPDLDAMRSWNAYLGKLPSQKLCVEGEILNLTLSRSPSRVASAFVDFTVDSVLAEPGVDMLTATLSGHDLQARIKSERS
jgi:hypothetical protein